MPAAFYLGFSILSWSLYPLVTIFGVENISPFTFVFITQTVGALSALVMYVFSVRKISTGGAIPQIVSQELTLDRIIFLLAIGISSNLVHICFIFAIELTSKAGASIIFETWPVAAVLLTPLIIRKHWDKIRLKHLFYGLISVAGIAMIMFSEQGDVRDIFTSPVEYVDSMDFLSLVGCLLAFAGAICMAISTLMRAQVSNHISITFPAMRGQVGAALLGEAVCRLSALPLAIILVFMFPDESRFTATNVSAMLFMGIFIHVLSTAAYTVALLKSDNPSMHIYWFIMPALAALWLHLLGLSEITPWIAAGMITVVIANLLLALDNKRLAKKTAEEIA